MKRLAAILHPACTEAFCMFWLCVIVVLCISGAALAGLTEHFEAGIIVFCGGIVLAVVMWTFFLRAVAMSARVTHSGTELPSEEGPASDALPKDVIP